MKKKDPRYYEINQTEEDKHYMVSLTYVDSEKAKLTELNTKMVTGGWD